MLGPTAPRTLHPVVGSLIPSLDPRAFGNVLDTQRPGRIIISAPAENHPQPENTPHPRKTEPISRPPGNEGGLFGTDGRGLGRSGSLHRAGVGGGDGGPPSPASVFVLAGIDACLPAFRQDVLVPRYPRGSQDLRMKRCGVPMDIRTTPDCLPIADVQEGLAQS